MIRRKELHLGSGECEPDAIFNTGFTCLQEAKLLAMTLYRLWRELLLK